MYTQGKKIMRAFATAVKYEADTQQTLDQLENGNLNELLCQTVKKTWKKRCTLKDKKKEKKVLYGGFCHSS